MEESILTKRQRDVLHKLAWGWSAERIMEKFSISSVNFHTICHQIRKRTGIIHTQNAEECRNWERGHRPTTPPWYQPGPTKMQLAVMKLRAQAMEYPEIASRLAMGAQTAQNHCSQGCKRAGITGAKHNRIYALRSWFICQDLKNNPEPTPSPTVPDDF